MYSKRNKPQIIVGKCRAVGWARGKQLHGLLALVRRDDVFAVLQILEVVDVLRVSVCISRSGIIADLVVGREGVAVVEGVCVVGGAGAREMVRAGQKRVLGKVSWEEKIQKNVLKKTRSRLKLPGLGLETKACI